MPVWELANWRGGRKTLRGEPVRVEPEVVTVVTPHEVERFIGARGERRLAFLRELRERGWLICERERLTQRVRFEAPGAMWGRVHRRCYVFRGRRRDIPRARSRGQGRARARVICI